MPTSRPYPYGTVLRLKESVAANGGAADIHRRRRYMVIRDHGERDIECVALVTEYDDRDQTHFPSPSKWESVDE